MAIVVKINNVTKLISDKELPELQHFCECFKIKLEILFQ